MAPERCEKCKYKAIVAPYHKILGRNLVGFIIPDTVTVTMITLVLRVKFVLFFYA